MGVFILTRHNTAIHTAIRIYLHRSHDSNKNVSLYLHRSHDMAIPMGVFTFTGRMTAIKMGVFTFTGRMTRQYKRESLPSQVA